MQNHSILIVEDDRAVVDITTRMLEQEGFTNLQKAYSGQEAIQQVEKSRSEVVLLDLGLPDLSGEVVLEKLKEEFPDITVIIVTALSEVDTAVRCMSKGAYDYIVKGSDPGRILTSLRKALEVRKREQEFALLRERMQSPSLNNPKAFEPILTVSERMKALFRFIEGVAPTEEPVLIVGETGVGKELFARAVHEASGRKGAFVATNLGGVEDSMLADTLFGHKTGAYTGAQDVRSGLIATAEGGTLFLDEIGDLSMASQVKLLRLLENGEYYPLGSDASKRSNARIVAATNRDLETLSREGKFRKDLLYRLSTFKITVPPLRERKEDLPLLCAYWLEDKTNAHTPYFLSPEAIALLYRYPFPGNVRELRSLLLRAQVLCTNRTIDAALLSTLIEEVSGIPESGSFENTTHLFPSKLPTIRHMIDDLVKEALQRTGGRQNEAAALLGITPQALSKRLRQRRVI
ncbi:MAG: sigma-54 dependent transcriptional regulator [Spirochaetales bacterium]